VERWARADRRVETRDGLRARLFDALVRDHALATPFEARLALAEAIPEIGPREALSEAFARQRGDAWERTLDAVDDALGVLRRAGTSAESLARVGREAQGGVASRARMLLAALRAVDERLEARGLVDPRSMGVLLAERFAAHPPARVAMVVGAAEVTALFVLDWEGGDAAWWRALDRALVRAGGGGARAELPSFEERLDAARDRGPLDVVTEDVARALDTAPRGVGIAAPLGDLRLFGPVPPASKARLEIRTATDAEAQARAVLGAVRRAIVGGCGPEDVAITGGELDEEAVAALRRAFEEEKIPLFDARGAPPTRAGIADFVLNALAAAERGPGRLDVAALARSSYVDPLRIDASPQALIDVARALERTPTASGEGARAALEATVRASVALGARGRLSADEAARLGDARTKVALRLFDLLLPLGERGTRADLARRTRRFLDAIGGSPTARARVAALASDQGGAAARTELVAFARDARAYGALEYALAEHEAAAARLGVSDRVVAPRSFRHELAWSMRANAETPEAARAGAVRIAELEDLAAEKLALLVVIDANDGALPSHSSGDPIVHEGLAAPLRAIDPVRAPASPAARAARQLTSLALAASRAEAIVLTRRSRDAEGAVCAPSPLVAWLERDAVPSSTWRASPLDGPAVTAHEAALRRTSGAGGDARDVDRRARVERARESRFERIEPPPDPVLGDLDHLPELPPVLASALAADTGGADRPLAVTSLERFATCPFQGYAGQVLQARRERPVRELPDRRETGTLLHRALAAAFVATTPLWPERPRRAELIRERADAATAAVLQGESVASPLRRLALARVRDAVRAVVTWSLANEDWDFALAEQPFGDPHGSWPPLVLGQGDARLSLRGSIDRLDRGHERAAVRAIDYKTSPRAAEASMRAFGETAFQVGLYARAAADALGTPSRGGLYLGATRPDDVGAKVRKDFDAAWAALHAAAPDGATPIERRALQIVANVRRGSLAPRPVDDAACTTCDASGGCRKPRFAIARDDDGAGGGA
jgi:RecB family exonuclease